MIKQAPDDYSLIGIAFRNDKAKPKLVSESTNFTYHYLPFHRRLYGLLFRFWRLPVNPWLPFPPQVMWYPNFVTFPYVHHTYRIVTLHDFTYVHFPEMVSGRNLKYLRRFVPYSVAKASLLTTVSRAVKTELQALTGTRKPIEVVYPPVSFPATQRKPRHLKADQFLLSVGTLEPRKNIDGLLDTFTALPPKLQQKYPLIIAGRKGWIAEATFRRLRDLEREGNVTWLDGPSDEELHYLYVRATALVSMSTLEGFGLPLVEAAHYGLPVIAFDTSVAREVLAEYGGAAFAPNVHAATEALERLLARPARTQPFIFNDREGARAMWKLIRSSSNKIRL